MAENAERPTVEGAGRLALYMVVYIGPLGFSYPADVTFHQAPPDPFSITHGEGNALVFALEDGDYSTEFSRALRAGDVLADFRRCRFALTMRRRAPSNVGRAPEDAAARDPQGDSIP